MDNLKIITSTTRPGHKGILIAEWLYRFAQDEKLFNVELLDLAKINLPLMDEPEHPRFRKYQHAHTKAWSSTIGSADAFVIVLGEYNFGFPAPIKNALDYLYHEWSHKPMGFVSYGGVSGGIRSLQMIKQVVTAMNAMPLVEAVNIPMFTQHISDNAFHADEKITTAAKAMLHALARWSAAMKPLRG